MNPHVWIIGKGGLLGSHLLKAASADHMTLWNPPQEHFSWTDTATLHTEMQHALDSFFSSLQKNDRWCIAWAAGIGTMGSSASELQSETQAWEMFLELLDEKIRQGAPAGCVFHASSAGSVYGNQPDILLAEESVCMPQSAYGIQKLAQENLLKTHAEKWTNVSTVIGRITNLYGPHQNLSKPQGLISHMSRLLLLQKPINIFVPLDTIRDYIFIDDAAKRIVRSLRRLDDYLKEGRAEHMTKIFASQQITTIAQIVGIFTRIAKKHPRIVSSERVLGSMYPQNLRFESTVWKDIDDDSSTPFIDGIARVHQYQLTLLRDGRLGS